MAIASNPMHAFRILNQCMTNLVQLQRDVRSNAAAWKSMAQGQTQPIVTIAGFMTTAAAAYSTRLGWLDALQANTSLWNRVRTIWTVLGGTAADFNDIVTPLRAVANQLPLADKSSYAAIITACDQILAAVDAPDTLWPE